MNERLTPELDAFARERRASGELFGASIDEDERTVTLFVRAGKPLAGLPHELDGLQVTVVPLPPAKAFRNVS